MNKQRRVRIGEAVSLLNDARDILQECADEEMEYLDNMPENLQGSEKYELAESAADALTESVDHINDAIDYAEQATE